MAPDKSPLVPAGEGQRLSAGRHSAMSAFWFATNLLWGALLMVVIPSQMKSGVAPHRPAETAGLLVGLGAIPAVIIPLVVGPMSDRRRSRWGRRRPFIVAGVAVNLVGLVVIWLAGVGHSLGWYVAGYLITNIGNNVATAAYMGVIPDTVPADQRGVASGWMAAMSQTGTICGVVSSGLLFGAGLPSAAFLVMAASLVLFAAATVVGVREAPSDGDAPAPSIGRSLTSLWIDPRLHPDFAWVWITRALVMMGQYTVQEFMMNFLTDVVKVPETRREVAAAGVLVVGLGCATITGMLGGSLSDRVGRKVVVYGANGVIAATCLGLIWVETLPAAFAAAAIFGLGFGAYVSVDYALGCDVLPSARDAGKDMAVWHVAMVLPQAIALPVAGALLGAFGRTEVRTAAGVVTQYNRDGYTAIFLLASCFLVLGAVLLRNVRGVK